MAEKNPDRTDDAFIGAELRDAVLPDLERYSALAPSSTRDEIERRVSELLRSSAGGERFSGDEVLAKNAQVVCAGVEDETVLLNMQKGDYFTLNRLGTVIWGLIDGDAPLSAICSSICERYEVALDEAWRDLCTLAGQLLQEGMVFAVEGAGRSRP